MEPGEVRLFIQMENHLLPSTPAPCLCPLAPLQDHAQGREGMAPPSVGATCPDTPVWPTSKQHSVYLRPTEVSGAQENVRIS